MITHSRVSVLYVKCKDIHKKRHELAMVMTYMMATWTLQGAIVFVSFNAQPMNFLE